MMGLQPLLWEQGLSAHEKPPAKPVDIYLLNFLIISIYNMYIVQKFKIFLISE